MSNEEIQDLTQFLHEYDPTECLATIELEAVDENTVDNVGGCRLVLFTFISWSSLELPLYPGEDIIVGRDRSRWYVIKLTFIPSLKPCSRYSIVDDRISKRHFRIYSIIYDANSLDFPPLIYCEDLESSNGTYVNGVLIGKITQERVGYLLCDGDVVEIRPLWKFRFHQMNYQVDTRSKGLWSDREACVSSFCSVYSSLFYIVFSRPFWNRRSNVRQGPIRNCIPCDRDTHKEAIGLQGHRFGSFDGESYGTICYNSSGKMGRGAVY